MAKKQKETNPRTLSTKVDGMTPDELAAKYAPSGYDRTILDAEVERLKAAEAAKLAFKEVNREVLKAKEEVDAAVRNAKRTILAALIDAFNAMPDDTFAVYFADLPKGVEYLPRYEVRGTATLERRQIVAERIAVLQAFARSDADQFEAIHITELLALQKEQATFDQKDEQAILEFCVRYMPHALMVNRAVFDAYIEALEGMAYFAKQPLVTPPARLIACMLPSVGNVSEEPEAAQPEADV